jgi:two-component system OmpR family response regulator
VSSVRSLFPTSLHCTKSAVANVWQGHEKTVAAVTYRHSQAIVVGVAAADDAPRRVLVVEDEPHIRDLVALHLRLDGWTVSTVGHGEEALRLMQAEPFDLIVLDLMLPGLDGLTILKALRRGKLNGDVPVLLLTARREEVDKVLGLESGADDYLTKPFGVRELVARANALTRRPRATPAAAAAPAAPLTPTIDGEPPVTAPVQLRNVTIDPARRRVTVDGRTIDLTSLEFDLLHLLAASPGIVFSRRALLSRVWKDDTFVTERSVDTLVKRLRRKIEIDPADPQLILTVWGAGYKANDV